MARLPTDIKALAREHTADAIKVLASIMNDPSAPTTVRVSAATYLMAHGFSALQTHTKMVPDMPTYLDTLTNQK